ncbi:hypothetical protein, partial [Psychrobacter sp. TB20-MNA-CIBAN-0197]|uniref:hypothetical protein n=1 Tax=Psychrobacter sp. TB20-MNA-CIBAN-0197 TaxID=3140453 RepID=UPI0033287092
LHGSRQAVRQQVLNLPCVVSNPAAPAIYEKTPTSQEVGVFLCLRFTALELAGACAMPKRRARRSLSAVRAGWFSSGLQG